MKLHIGHQGVDTYTVNNTELPVVQAHTGLKALSHVDGKIIYILYTVFVLSKLK